MAVQIWRLQSGLPQGVWPGITCMETSELSAANTVAGTDGISLPNQTRDLFVLRRFSKNVNYVPA